MDGCLFNSILFLVSSLMVSAASLFCLKQSKTLLTAWIALLGVMANLFVLKQITLFGMNATASDVFAVGSLLGLNLLREHFDMESCKKAILISFFCMMFFGLMAQLHLLYIPNDFDHSQEAYRLLLQHNFRIIIASVGVFFTVQIIDVLLYTLFLKHLNSFALRNILSLSISQAIDTALFSFVGLYGLVDDIISIMLISYVIKLTAIASVTPLTTFSRKWIVNPA